MPKELPMQSVEDEGDDSEPEVFKMLD